MSCALPNDEEQIRTLIEQWAAAVHTGDRSAATPNAPAGRA
jgi:hypothetical protein